MNDPSNAIVQTVHVSYSAKMSKNYQSADASIGITIEVGQDDDTVAIAKWWVDKFKPFVHDTCRRGLGELSDESD